MLVKIASLVVPKVVRADVFVAHSFGRLSLVLKATEERLGDAFLKVRTWEARDYIFAQVFRERLISNAKHIKANAIEQQVDF